jgi:hypothetical protein
MFNKATKYTQEKIVCYERLPDVYQSTSLNQCTSNTNIPFPQGNQFTFEHSPSKHDG